MIFFGLPPNARASRFYMRYCPLSPRIRTAHVAIVGVACFLYPSPIPNWRICDFLMTISG